MNTFPVLLGALCVYALAYRYYSAFIAAKALALDDRRTTPAHLYADGHNYVASPRWVLFGHHFAAIAGAGPLVGPTLAAQFGFAPGFLWILIGAVLAGCVQDFTVLVASIRHRGRSLADVARTEISPFAGLVAMIAVLFILLVTLAGLGIVTPLRPLKPLYLRVTYQDSCHLLHGQKVRNAPRDLLKQIPGLELVELPHSDICCGSAGVYNVTQTKASLELLDDKMKNIASIKPEVIVTANPGCLLQLRAGVQRANGKQEVMHVVELLDRSMRAKKL